MVTEAELATFALVIAPERWKSMSTGSSCSSFHTEASACRLAALVSSVKAASASSGTMVCPRTRVR
ncbi:MAG: hypothetical protein BWY79_01928 [Actinobacteria bacterium ADurb.Bin444]|nr:MAG: hypothetical protein BWY79_01928 [Actinobacteria bacterium ADurb.Bin444]